MRIRQAFFVVARAQTGVLYLKLSSVGYGLYSWSAHQFRLQFCSESHRMGRGVLHNQNGKNGVRIRCQSREQAGSEYFISIAIVKPLDKRIVRRP